MSASTSVDRDWLTLLRPGDLVVVAQGVGEPTSLLNDLLDAAPDVQVFVGLSHSNALSAPRAKLPRLVSFGAMGPLSALAQTGRLEIIPCNFVDVPRTLRARVDQRLVVLLQVCPAAHGRHSLGMAVDYTYELLSEAALVVAEINEQMPATSAPTIASERIDFAVPTSRPLPQVRPRSSSEVQSRIAAHAADLVSDGATIQLGFGGLASAVGAQLVGRRDLRVHSPLAGDWLATLAQADSLRPGPDSARICEAAGSQELYALVAAGEVSVLPVGDFNEKSLCAAPGLVAMNSALQVDLSGQVNAEQIRDQYVGGIGGQADLLRAAQRSPGGRSVIMMPATTTDGRSRIVSQLDCGVVTSPRASVDFVVTEYGTADLRGRTLGERAAALTAVAAPDHRRPLSDWHRRP